MRVAAARIGGRPALVCGTGYTGEDGVELLIDPEVAPAIWAELLDAGVVPCGLGARDTLRLEVCFHLHGNDLTPERNPIEAGLGWCCVEATGFVGSEAVAARARRGHRPRSWPRSRSRAPASRAQGNPVLAGGEPVGDGHQRHLLALARGRASGWPTCAPTSPSREPRSRSTCAASVAPARIASKPLYREGEAEPWPRRTTPTSCSTTTSTTGPGSRATSTPIFGITWYAQDSLGEVVFYDPPEVGATIAKDASYAEVESVKAVSDVIAPLSGEIVEVNDALGDAPEKINEDPYGEGWLVKVKLTAPGEAEALLGAAEYRKLLES